MVKRLVCLVATSAACASPVPLDVKIVDPCNKPVLASLGLLGYEARGTDLGAGLSAFTVEGDKAFADVPIPLVSDFQLVVLGYEGDRPKALPDAAGVSARYDLTSASDPVTITVPIAPFNDFYKPTNLAAPTMCTALSRARHGATATWVPSIGKVVIIGGESIVDGSKLYPRTVEAFDPKTGMFETIYEFKRQEGGERAYHTATLISGDRILIAGGEFSDGSMAASIRTVVLLDVHDASAVAVEAVPPTGFLTDERAGHTAVKLANGEVAFMGGRKLVPQSSNPMDQQFQGTIEVFSPDTKFMYRPNGAPALEQARYGHSATVLGTGKDVMVVGGYNENGPLRSIEVVHLEGKMGMNRVTNTGTTTGVGPIYHAAAVDEAGRVMLSGGYGSIADADPSNVPITIPKNPSNAVELWQFNDATATLSRVCTDSMSVARGRHASAMSGDLAVFVGGHDADGTTLATGEFATYRPTGTCFVTRPTIKTMNDQRARFSLVELGSGELLAVGGYRWLPTEPVYTSISGAELFSPRRKP